METKTSTKITLEVNEMKKAIYFDMDGTLADLYSVDGWLDCLENRDVKPYREAKPMVNMNHLSVLLNKLQSIGYHIGVVTWLCRDDIPEYHDRITTTKLDWLNKYMPTVAWDEVDVVKYGTPKHEVVKYPYGIIFDDDEKVRGPWTGTAYNVDNIIHVLTEELKNAYKVRA